MRGNLLSQKREGVLGDWGKPPRVSLPTEVVDLRPREICENPPAPLRGGRFFHKGVLSRGEPSYEGADSGSVWSKSGPDAKHPGKGKGISKPRGGSRSIRRSVYPRKDIGEEIYSYHAENFKHALREKGGYGRRWAASERMGKIAGGSKEGISTFLVRDAKS